MFSGWSSLSGCGCACLSVCLPAVHWAESTLQLIRYVFRHALRLGVTNVSLFSHTFDQTGKHYFAPILFIQMSKTKCTRRDWKQKLSTIPKAIPQRQWCPWIVTDITFWASAHEGRWTDLFSLTLVNLLNIQSSSQQGTSEIEIFTYLYSLLWIVQHDNQILHPIKTTGITKLHV